MPCLVGPPVGLITAPCVEAEAAAACGPGAVQSQARGPRRADLCVREDSGSVGLVGDGHSTCRLRYCSTGCKMPHAKPAVSDDYSAFMARVSVTCRSSHYSE
jgi:hypothetical protein